MLDFNIIGGTEARRTLEGLGHRVDREMKRASLASALIVQAYAKEKGIEKGGYRRGPMGGRVPTPKPAYPHVYRRTGHLSRHINADVRKTRDGYEGLVGTDVRYGKFLELGTRHIRARLFLERSLAAEQRRVNREFDKAMERAVGRG